MGNTLDELTFGEFITVKRKQLDISLRQLSQMLSLSATYLSHMERGMRPAPTYENQVKIADLLRLSEQEKECFFDLAARTRTRNTIPLDIAEYIMHDQAVRVFLRTAIQLKYSGEDLLNLI
jgi:transcriptional regulator with XRE-family HTH domain